MAKIRLTRDQDAELARQQRELQDILPEIDKYEQLGEDATLFRETHREAMERITKLRTLFGPNSK